MNKALKIMNTYFLFFSDIFSIGKIYSNAISTEIPNIENTETNSIKYENNFNSI